MIPAMNAYLLALSLINALVAIKTDVPLTFAPMLMAGIFLFLGLWIK